MERLEIAKQTTNKKVKHAIAKDSESKWAIKTCTVGNLCQRRNINANVKNGTETKR